MFTQSANQNFHPQTQTGFTASIAAQKIRSIPVEQENLLKKIDSHITTLLMSHIQHVDGVQLDRIRFNLKLPRNERIIKRIQTFIKMYLESLQNQFSAFAQSPFNKSSFAHKHAEPLFENLNKVMPQANEVYLTHLLESEQKLKLSSDSLVEFFNQEILNLLK